MANFISEDNIEQASINLLVATHKYNSIKCYTPTPEMLPDNSGRANKKQVVLPQILLEQLIKLNPDIPEETIKAAKINKVTAQIDALTEVLGGASDVAIIDITMAQSVVGKGEYADLEILDGASYGDEIFAVGLRKGSDLKPELDAFLKAKYADGSLAALAEKYSVGLNTEALGE